MNKRFGMIIEKNLKPAKLSLSRFRAYGRLIRYPGKSNKSPRHNLFRIVLTEPSRQGWRIAYLIVRDKTIRRMEQHPDSFESFEPIRGRSLIFVAKTPRLSAIRCFYLDQPLIVNKGIWHGVVTLDKESEMKLTENAKVRCEYWNLERRLP